MRHRTLADRQNSAGDPSPASLTFAILTGALTGVLLVLEYEGLVSELVRALFGR